MCYLIISNSNNLFELKSVLTTFCGVCFVIAKSNSHEFVRTLFTPFQCWLQPVVFRLKWDFLLNLVLILIIFNLPLWVLYYKVKKLWNTYFWTTLACSFTCYQRIFNLLKSSLWICHLKMIKMYRKLDRKSPFTYAATWWSSTLESGE